MGLVTVETNKGFDSPLLPTDLYIEMGNLVDAIYKYFADEKVPLSTKVKLTILGLLALVLADNHYGFSHTVINSYKVDYMMKLEEAKQRYKEDTAFVAEIDHLIEIEHNRKGVVQKFCSLLSPKVDEKQISCMGIVGANMRPSVD